MSLELAILNRQRARPVHARLLRQIVLALLKEQLEISEARLGVTLVAAPEMTRLNEHFLQHHGSTDVITFDHRKSEAWSQERAGGIHGEIFVCVDEALLHARRFRTSWTSEVVRYIVHGVLHLLGHDDRHPADRRRMKREENRLLRALTLRFALSRLARKTKLRR